MMNKKVNRFIYIGAVLVLIVAGVIVWYQQMENSETKTFTVEHKQDVTFQFQSTIKNPERIKIRFEGKIACDALLVIKDGGSTVKSRTTFPLKAGDLKNKTLECDWSSSDISLQLKTKECEINGLKVILEVVE